MKRIETLADATASLRVRRTSIGNSNHQYSIIGGLDYMEIIGADRELFHGTFSQNGTKISDINLQYMLQIDSQTTAGTYAITVMYTVVDN